MLKSKSLALAAIVTSVTLTAPAALAQYKLQTPDGHQTIGPSQMPQQPMPQEDFANNAHGKVVPSPGPDIPGVPNFVAPPTGNKANPPTRSGVIQDQTNGQGQGQGAQNQSGNMQKGAKNQAPQAPATAPGNNDQPGALVMPQGESSTVRVGPVEPISIWTRLALGAVILVQFAFLLITAVALHVVTVRNRNLYQGGEIINEDFRESYPTEEVPLRRAS